MDVSPRTAHNACVSDAPVQLEEVTDPVLGESFDFTPEAEVESWRLTVPAKGACYVLLDAERRPVLLATCGDLRHALVQRLGPQDETQKPTKKIDYRAIVRHVRYRPVFSRFEAHWTYLENARRFWPKTYRKLIRHWRAHWVVINPSDTHPRFDITDEPTGDPSSCFGPFIEAAAARRYTETLEDLFDLCRYPHILAQAPHGQACAYKQMGRCPAPCDGSVPMDRYRLQVEQALRFVTEPQGPWLEQWRSEMRLAAAAQEFERAAGMKSRIEKASTFTPTRGFAPQAAHRLGHLGLFRGDGKGTLRAILCTPDRVLFLGQSPAKTRDAWLDCVRRAASGFRSHATEFDVPAAERANLLAWHLLGGRKEDAWVPLSECHDLSRLHQAAENLLHRETPRHEVPLENHETFTT